MSTVYIGSASIDENGNISGGKAGNQTGKELKKQAWYLHSKGWRVFRPILTDVAEKIAKAMEKAIANQKIGYDQGQRNTLYYQIKDCDFDPSLATTACETDCSALVRVCCCYAGVTIGDMNTSTEPSVLLASGAFKELKDSKYTKKSAYLRRGDILVTKTKGHTVVVLTSGSECEDYSPATNYSLGDRTLSNGDEGSDVKELQSYLIQLGYNCGRWGADGDFGDSTELAVEKFQKDHGCAVDGVFGSESHKAMLKALDAADIDIKTASKVRIIGGNCYVRSEPNTGGAKLGVAHVGNEYTSLSETSPEGWHKINYKGAPGWVSGKYSELV